MMGLKQLMKWQENNKQTKVRDTFLGISHFSLFIISMVRQATKDA